MRTSYESKRNGDIRDSHASIDKAIDLLQYEPNIKLKEGLLKSIKWYKENISKGQMSSSIPNGQ